MSLDSIAGQISYQIVSYKSMNFENCFVPSRQVSTVGITSLGIDHTSLLGNTIEEIAWQKAGIMKPGSIAFTVDHQPEAALEVLKQRASEKKVRANLWQLKELVRLRRVTGFLHTDHCLNNF
jgi:folylpolyglutamate synthase/dihydropteroate synthase